MSTTRKYVKKPKDASKGETPFNEIRITGTDYVGKYITYAASLLLEGRETEAGKPKEKVDKIVLKATGVATKGACLVAEILKHRIVGLHQLNKIETITVVDEYEPLEEDLDHIKIERKLAVFEIYLSTNDGVLDEKAPGYQPPLPKNEVQEEDLAELLKKRGEGRPERREGGRGGRRRGGRDGRGFRGGRGGRRGTGGRRGGRGRDDDGYRGERRDDGYRSERRDDGYRSERRDDGYRSERRDDGYRGDRRDDGYRSDRRDDGYRGDRRDDRRGDRRGGERRGRGGDSRGRRGEGRRGDGRRGDGRRGERGTYRSRGDRRGRE